MRRRVARLERLPRAELEARCRRALFAGARRHWRGPRVVLRRAVRRYLRENRRDRAHLLHALRAVAASSAAALLVLGLAPAAEAGAGFVDRSYHRKNPLPRISVNNGSKPALVDIDADGDLDLFSGMGIDLEPYPGFYGNEGSGHFAYFENTGSASAPAFLQRTGSRNPLGAFVVYFNSTPAFADLDGDGDLDAVSGSSYGGFSYFENTGTAASPAFVERTGSQNPLDVTPVPSWSTPAFGDVDGDGDLDFVSGDRDGTFLYLVNTGSASAPAFSPPEGTLNPFAFLDVGRNSAPALVDLDDDGDLDLLSGEYQGTLSFFENTGGALPLLSFVERTGSQNPLGGFDVGDYSAPVFADLDDDGDLDAVSGTGRYDPPPEGRFVFLENSGSASSPAFAQRTGSQSPVAGFDAGNASAPALADLDGDGDLDVVSATTFYNYSGPFAYFENTGSASAPAFAVRSGSLNPLDALTGRELTLGDLDGDGDLDLVARDFGGFRYFENTGSASAPAFVERTGTQNPLDGFGGAPTLGDLDGDGDLDLVARGSGGFRYLENTGSASAPAFVERTGTQNPLDGLGQNPLDGYPKPPALGDLDGDGDLDVVAGGAGHWSIPPNGTFFFFENTGSANAPAFTERTGSHNPLAGFDVGYYSTPALADLDGDGDVDVVSGEYFGRFGYFENRAVVPLPVPGWARLGAALGLLAGLWRARGGAHR